MNSHATSECSEAYIALGANLGDREDNLMEALERLHEVPGIMVERVSNLYETEPVGYVDQPMFLNMAAAVSTSLSPHELLAEMRELKSDSAGSVIFIGAADGGLGPAMDGRAPSGYAGPCTAASPYAGAGFCAQTAGRYRI